MAENSKEPCYYINVAKLLKSRAASTIICNLNHDHLHVDFY